MAITVPFQSILDYNKIIQVRDARLRGLPVRMYDKGLLEFILSPRNRNSGQNMLNLANAKQLIEQALVSGNGKVVNFSVRPTFNPRMAGVTNVGTNECDFDSNETAQLVQAQLGIENRVAATVKFDPRTCSSQESYDEQLANSLMQLYEDFNYKLYAFVLKELLRKDGAQFVHIGNSPSRDANTAYTPGHVVNIFMGDGLTPNRAGITQLQQELQVAMIDGNDGYSWGSSLWDALGKNIAYYAGADDSGFISSFQTVPFLNQARFALNADITTDLRAKGINNPLLILKEGAVQLVTSPRWTNPLFQVNTGDQIKTVTTVPGFGIDADLTTNIDNCGDYPVWTFKLEVRAALWTAPGCITEALSEDFREKYNGVMLYDAACSDQSFCDTPEFNRVVVDQSRPYNNDCEVEETVCDAVTACSVAVAANYLADGTLILTAYPQPIPPATIVSYSWTKNGNPFISTGPQIVIGDADWESGDIFEVTIADSTGCTASASITVLTPYAALRVQQGGLNRANGANIAISRAKSIGVIESFDLVLSSENDLIPVEISDLDLSNNNPSLPSTYTGVPTSYPVTVSQTSPLTVSINQDLSASGVVVHTLQVVSNDADSPVYEITVTITIA